MAYGVAVAYHPPDEILERYARVLVDFALGSGRGIRKGDVVRITVSEEAKPMYVALRNAVNLKDAFLDARSLVRKRELREHFEPSNPLIVDALYATFRVEAKAGTIRACAVCWDALVPRQEGGGLMDAIAIGLEHRDGDPTVVLCGYKRELTTGDYLFQDPVTAAGRRHVFGHVLMA